MKTEEEIRKELELLEKIKNIVYEYNNYDALTDVIARISTLEWVLDIRKDDDKISKAIREAILKDLKCE